MKAVVYREHGSPDVLSCEEIDRPVPADGEVLIKVRAASVNPLDFHLMRGGPYLVRVLLGLAGPRVRRPGVDVAGRVEAVGRNVTQFEPGDDVFGACRGAFAEFACGAESKLVSKPDDMSFEQAACVPVAAITALQGLRDKGRIQPGQSVLINGAAGGVGTFAVQIARSFGASVTGVCSTRNLDLVRSLGAERVIDYTREDFTKGSQSYDLILDCVANLPLSALRRVLRPKGTCVLAGGPNETNSLGLVLGRAAAAPVYSRLVRRRIVSLTARLRKHDLIVLRDLLQAGKLTPVIDRRYGLSEVPEALRYLEAGHARGKLVVALA